MGLEPRGVVGVAGHVGAVGEAVAEQGVHHAAGQRAVGAGADDELHVGLLHRGVVVDVDRHDGGAARLPGLDGVGHDVDLGHDRVGAPQHDAVGALHLARVEPRHAAVAGLVAGPGQGRADGGILVRIALGVAQAVDAVALHEAHRAGVIVGPHAFGAVARLRGEQPLGGAVERLRDADLAELAGALGPGAQQRRRQPVRVVDALGVAGHLGADDAGRVAVVGRAVDAPHAARVEHLDLQRAGRRAIVRAGRGAAERLQRGVHGASSCAGQARPARPRRGGPRRARAHHRPARPASPRPRRPAARRRCCRSRAPP